MFKKISVFTLMIDMSFLRLAPGNCAIIKPSEVSEHTAQLLEEIFPQYLDKVCKHFSSTRNLKEHIEDKTTSLLVQIYNRIRILVMLQIMRLNISYQLYVITKKSAIISRYLTAKF